MIVLVYLAAIVAANVSAAALGPLWTPVNAFLFVGLDLTLRDALHARWHHRQLALRMGLLVIAGGALSYLATPGAGQIAAASAVSWALATVADTAVFAWLYLRVPAARAVLGSNVAAAAVDSVLFPTLAFGTLLPAVVLLQFVAKVAGGAVWLWALLRLRAWRAGRRAYAEPEAWELEYQSAPDPEVDW